MRLPNFDSYYIQPDPEHFKACPQSEDNDGDVDCTCDSIFAEKESEAAERRYDDMRQDFLFDELASQSGERHYYDMWEND
jgi:hypothetical protein